MAAAYTNVLGQHRRGDQRNHLHRVHDDTYIKAPVSGLGPPSASYASADYVACSGR